jgi:hypothetical protein
MLYVLLALTYPSTCVTLVSILQTPLLVRANSVPALKAITTIYLMLVIKRHMTVYPVQHNVRSAKIYKLVLGVWEHRTKTIQG